LLLNWKDWLSCRETWAWPERFSLYNRQIMILSGKAQRNLAFGPFPALRAIVFCTGCLPVSLVLYMPAACQPGADEVNKMNTGQCGHVNLVFRKVLTD
jgi:hypothetical protein